MADSSMAYRYQFNSIGQPTFGVHSSQNRLETPKVLRNFILTPPPESQGDLY